MLQRLVVASLFLCVFLAACAQVQAASLSLVSDLISTSAPGASATHIIQFTLTQAVPPSGQIIITPVADAFTIPLSFDYTDVEFSVATSSSYVDRLLSSTPGAVADGVAVVSGTSGSITLTLNSTTGLAAGSKVRVTLAASDSSQDMTNPDGISSYRIRIATGDGAGSPLDSGTAMVAVVAPVGISSTVISIAPFRFNGLPSGSVAANNSTIEISLQTDIPATCRYATSTGIAYDAMAEQFSPNIGQVFYTTLTGFQNATSYNYYVRCDSTQGNENTDDYDLSFTLDPTPTTDTSLASTNSSSGRGGIGQYVGGSAVLYLGSVSFSGFTVPFGSVTILEDGTNGATAKAQADGSFTANVPGLERGVYSFDIYATDTNGIKTAPDSETLTVTSGSTNAISGVLLPPSIALASSTIAVGASAQVSGQATPGDGVAVSVIDASGQTQTFTATSSTGAGATAGGAWNVTIPGSDLAQGTYLVKARTVQSDGSTSDFSQPLSLGVGQSPSSGALGNSDLNGDGKVNLIDFSILLAAWGTANSNADLNGDGTVNLADLSILLFNWTG